jgi:uncharacterized membrane protein YfhO
VVRESGDPPRIRTLERAGDRVEIRLEPGGAAFLRLTDGYDPGWQATIDGAAAPLLPADLAFRGLALPAGARQIVMQYRPAEVRRGGLISLGTLLALLVGGAILVRRRPLLAAPGETPSAAE